MSNADSKKFSNFTFITDMIMSAHKYPHLTSSFLLISITVQMNMAALLKTASRMRESCARLRTEVKSLERPSSVRSVSAPTGHAWMLCASARLSCARSETVSVLQT